MYYNKTVPVLLCHRRVYSAAVVGVEAFEVEIEFTPDGGEAGGSAVDGLLPEY
jgi:hypothetical protein